AASRRLGGGRRLVPAAGKPTRFGRRWSRRRPRRLRARRAAVGSGGGDAWVGGGGAPGLAFARRARDPNELRMRTAARPGSRAEAVQAMIAERCVVRHGHCVVDQCGIRRGYETMGEGRHEVGEWQRQVFNRLTVIKLAGQLLERRTELSAYQRELARTSVE